MSRKSLRPNGPAVLERRVRVGERGTEGQAGAPALKGHTGEAEAGGEPGAVAPCVRRPPDYGRQGLSTIR